MITLDLKDTNEVILINTKTIDIMINPNGMIQARSAHFKIPLDIEIDERNYSMFVKQMNIKPSNMSGREAQGL